MTAFSRRHWAREALDALFLPLSMFQSKRAARGPRTLSALRVLLGVVMALVWRVLDSGSHFTMPDVWVLLVVVAALPLSDLFSMVPVREGLAALVAIFGGTVSKHVRTETVVEETTGQPAPAAAAVEPDTPDEPHEWADGSGDEGDA